MKAMKFKALKSEALRVKIGWLSRKYRERTEINPNFKLLLKDKNLLLKKEEEK